MLLHTRLANVTPVTPTEAIVGWLHPQAVVAVAEQYFYCLVELYKDEHNGSHNTTSTMQRREPYLFSQTFKNNERYIQRTNPTTRLGRKGMIFILPMQDAGPKRNSNKVNISAHYLESDSHD